MRAKHDRLIPFAVTLLAIVAAPARSQSDAEGAAAHEFPIVSFSLGGGVDHQFRTDLDDDNGSYSATRFAASAVPSITFNERLRLDLNFVYAYDGYDFSGSTGFGGMDPWDDVHTFRVAPRFNYAVDEAWTIVAAGIVGFSAESGADIDDAVTGGVIVGASYRVSEQLTIGGGVGVLSQIEDSATVFPIIVLDWRPTDYLVVRTVERIGASGGGGLEIGWEFAERWTLLLGGRYDTRRFRLADGGVGEETGLPLYLGLSVRPTDRAEVSVMAGAVFAGELQLEDDRGRKIQSEDFGAAPFVGLSFRVRF